MQNITVKFGKHNGELKPLTAEDSAKYFEFRKQINEGEVIELYITRDIDADDATLGQIAKVHACIRDLARFTGHTFEEMKMTIKEKAGLFNPASKEYLSFGSCSKEQLSDAIQICINVGNDIGYYMS